MVRNYETSSITTLAPLFTDEMKQRKRDQLRCDWQNALYGGQTTNRRALRTPKAFFYVEDLAILLLLNEVRNESRNAGYQLRRS